MHTAIEIRELRKHFKLRERAVGLWSSVRALYAPTSREVTAVDGVTFRIEAGERVAFVGPNGAGKSTTIKMLCGILHPSSGSAHVMGLVVAESLLIAVLGGALGVAGSRGLMWVLTHAPGIKDALAGIGLSELSLQPLVAVLGFGVAVFLGFAAGFVPALGAYRARITDMLRTV